jgi:tape measure domain-containing protein
MAKKADVEFRILGKSLATKPIKEVTEGLRDLIEAQEKQRNAATASVASLAKLEAGYKEIGATIAQLASRRSIVESLIGKRGDLDSARSKVDALKTKLEELLRLKSVGSPVDGLDKSIREARKALAGADKEFTRTASAVERLEKSVSSFGVDASKAEDALRDLAHAQEQAFVASVRGRQAIDGMRSGLELQAVAAREAADAENKLQRELAESIRFEQERDAARRQFRSSESRAGFEEGFAARAAAEQNLAEQQQAHQKDITAEVIRRNAIEEQAEARRLAAMRREGAEAERIAAKRASAYAAFSQARPEQLRTPAERQEALAQSQIRSQDAALRMLEINKRADAVEARLAASRARLGTATNKLAGDTRNAANAQRAFADDSRKSLGVYQRMTGQLYSLAAAYFGVFGAINVVRGAMEAVNEREGLEVKLRVANNGDVKAATEDMVFLKKTADELGLEFVALSKKFGDYKIAASAAGVSNELIRQSFTDLSKVVKVYRLSQEDADGVMRAMVQIMSKARVQAEELRGQLGDRLPGAVAAFAKANNIALSDLDEKLKKGTVGVDFVLRGLRAQAKALEKELPNATQTAASNLARLKTEYNEFLVVLGNSGVIEGLQGTFKALTEFLRSKEGTESAKQLGEAFKRIADVTVILVKNLDKLVLAFKLIIGLKLVVWANAVRVALLGWVGSLTTLIPSLRLAAAGTGALAVASRGLLAVLGPLGIGLAAATAAIYAFNRATKQGEERTERFVASLQRSRKAQGENIVGEARRIRKEMEDTLKVREDLTKRLSAAEKTSGIAQKSATLRGRTIGSTGLDKILGESPEILKEQLREANQQLIGFGTELVNLGKRYKEFKSTVTEEVPIPSFPTGKDAEEKKGPTSKQIQDAAEARADAARAIQKEILDLDQQIFDARLDGEIRTVEQIDRNYQITIDKIRSQIAEQFLGLDKLEQEAASKNGGTLSSSDADALKSARDRVEELRLALNTRAMEASKVQEIELAERNINELVSERNAQIDLINIERQAGLRTEHDAEMAILDTRKQYADSISTSVQEVMDLLSLIESSDPDLHRKLNLDEMLVKMQGIRIEAQAITSEGDRFNAKWGSQLAEGVGSTFETLAKGLADFATGVGSVSDAFKAARNSFLTFAADFLVNIGKMIMQAILLKAIKNAIDGTSGGYMQAMQGVFKFHSGGMIGAPNGKASAVSPLLFANAPRYHNGGFPGLSSDEVPIIAQRGEEMLSRTDPRNAMNGGGSPPPQLKIINAIDSSSVVSEAMNKRDGQNSVVNMMKARRQEVKAALGIK